MGKKKDRKKMVKLLKEVISSEEVLEKVFGTYSDGTVRSLSDSLRGEFLSPKQKKDAKKAKKKKKKDKKKTKEREELMKIFD